MCTVVTNTTAFNYFVKKVLQVKTVSFHALEAIVCTSTCIDLLQAQFKVEINLFQKILSIAFFFIFMRLPLHSQKFINSSCVNFTT